MYLLPTLTSPDPFSKYIFIENCEVELYNIFVRFVGEFSTMYNSEAELYKFEIKLSFLGNLYL